MNDNPQVPTPALLQYALLRLHVPSEVASHNEVFPRVPTHRTSPSIYLTVLLHPMERRGKSTEFDAAQYKEIKELVHRGTWRGVLRDGLPANANILSVCFVLTIKDVEYDCPIYKARFVVQVHLDKEKNSLIHDSNITKHSSIRIVVQ